MKPGKATSKLGAVKPVAKKGAGKATAPGGQGKSVAKTGAVKAPARGRQAGKPVAKAGAVHPSSGAVPAAPLRENELITLQGLVKGKVLRRPSQHNKSPYVGDVLLASGRECLVHMPSLDLGGKCVAGSEVYVRPLLDKQGRPVPAGQLGPYGTPKCEFVLQLFRCSEPENARLGGVWIGAHPRLGELCAEQLLQRGLIGALTQPLEKERTVPGLDMRCDFIATGSSGRTVVEVKTVTDTDFNPATPPPRTHCVFFGKEPYSRQAIFPWGSSAQTGPDGEKVVSSRAIKHVGELVKLAQRPDSDKAALLFVVVRADATAMRPNAEACPSFVKHLKAAMAKGVQVLARRVVFDVRDGTGFAVDAGPLRLEL